MQLIRDVQTMIPVRSSPQTLEAFAAQLVGSSLLLTVQDSVRRGMLREALGRTRGNFTRAAKLLGVQRQAVQQMVRRFELHGWVECVRGRSAIASNDGD